MNGPTVTATTSLPNAPNRNWRLQGSEDFNGDGRPDILWRDYENGTYGVWLMNGTNRQSSVTIGTTTDLNWQIQATGDFNGDGRPDIVWQHQTSGHTAIGLMAGTSVTQWVDLPRLPGTNLRLQGAGDFNHDGQLDLLLRNYLSGENLVWLMNGTTVADTVRITSGTNLDWTVQAVGDFNGDRKADIFWRNVATGANVLWLMNSLTSHTSLLIAPEPDLSWQATQWNRLPDAGLVDLSALSFNGNEGSAGMVQLRLNQAPQSPVTVTVQPSRFLSVDADDSLAGSQTQVTFTPQNWNRPRTIVFAADWDTSIENRMFGNTLTLRVSGGGLRASEETYELGSILQVYQPNSSLVALSDLAFSGREGDQGTFRLRLTQAPTSPVTLALNSGNFLVVDADGDARNGSQDRLTFTAANWNLPQTVSFIAEVDTVATDRTSGNTISYTLAGGGFTPVTGSYDLGTIVNTYSPDPRRFNIDLDFRNDYQGFWTPARRTLAQNAANAWSVRIADELGNLTLNNQLGRLDSGSAQRPFAFTTRRAVDDLVVFINNFEGTSNFEGGYGLADYAFGGFSPDAPLPRVGQVTINSALYLNQPDIVLYQTVLHELGHVLGLVGLNWVGASRLNWGRDGAGNLITATEFQGEYSRQANGGAFIPLESQDGLNPVTQQTYSLQNPPSHPARRVSSIMSYGGLYTLPGPTAIDFAMLADSGYRIRGYNVPIAA
jgi:hypothetical protein